MSGGYPGMVLSFSHVVIDCYDPQNLAQFWTEVLGTTVQFEWPEMVMLAATDHSPLLSLQAVPDPTPGKNKLHLNLRADDLEAETHRLLSLGATMVERLCMTGGSWVVLADPEDNRFCVDGPFDMSWSGEEGVEREHRELGTIRVNRAEATNCAPDDPNCGAPQG